MLTFAKHLNAINREQKQMLKLLEGWSRINSGSDNLKGLAEMLETLKGAFKILGGRVKELELCKRSVIDENGKLIEKAHGKALSLSKRPNAKVKVFLSGHMDTVYSHFHPFQDTTKLNNNTLQGPGVADMKGGLVVMLKALETLENHPLASNIGWEVLINPDEEIGSIGSEPLLAASASRNSFGLIFEPALPGGAIVSSRKGSANLTVVAKGRSAHAGRDHEKGRNAIVALAAFVIEANKLTDYKKGISINIGQISGGGAVNVVPDLAICRMNVRTLHPCDFSNIEQELKEMARCQKNDGIELCVHLQQSRPPKLFDKKTECLYEQLKLCADEEGIRLQHRPSGGACDGNLLASFGLTVIDSLGVVGDHIHTPLEYMVIDSLTERTRLTALFLLKLAAGEFHPVQHH